MATTVYAPPTASPAVHRAERDSTGLAVLLFIASEAMIFFAFFSAYFYLRGESATWPPSPHLERPELALVTLNTVLLLVSSATMHRATAGIRRGAVGQMMAGLAATLGLGTTFLLIQGWEYAHLGFSIRDGVFGSTFYALTSFHAFHVLIGLALLALLLNRGRKGRITPSRHQAVENVGYYWHFVDAVWVTLYLTVYVL